MIKKLLSYRPTKQDFLALEHSETNNALSILGVCIQLKKEELDVSQQFMVNTINDIGEYTKGSQKISLAITGDNILSKAIDSTATDTEILAEAFPNLNLTDFYYQILKTSTKSFVVVCRKEYVDGIIAEYQNAKIGITQVSLGNLKMAALLSYIQKEEVLNLTSKIQTRNQEIFAITTRSDQNKQQYDLEGISINDTHTLPVAIVLDSFSSETAISGNIDKKNTSLKNANKEATFFTKTLQYGIGFLLISLLINFFVFNSKYKKWQGLQEEIQVYTSQNESIKKQQTIVATKEAIVTSILTTGFSKSSFYTDRIIQLLPTTVALSSCTYQPIEKSIRADKAIQLKKNVITITGESIDKLDFTNWLNAIEELDFVDTVTIINYGVVKNNTSSFEIIIDLAHDTTK